MKKSVVSKVFISTVFILIITLFIQLFVQMNFIPDLYFNMRLKETNIGFNDFINDYIESDKSYNEIHYLTKEYKESILAPIIILDKNYTISNSSFFDEMNYIEVQSEDKKSIILLGNRVDETGNLSGEYLNLSLNRNVDLIGGKLNGLNVIILDYNQKNTLIEDIVRIKGKIIRTNFVKRKQGVYSYQSEKLLREIGLFFSDKPEKIGNFEFIENETGLNMAMKVYKLKDGGWIFSIFTIENLSEIFGVFNKYYIYFFVFQFFLFSILAFLYSKWITKPLKILSKDASRIAIMDFSKESKIKTGDELEILSNDLNLISKNMKNNIALLKQEALIKEENEKRMRELLANLSHEFKTPLGIMSGFLEMLEVSEDDESREYCIQIIFKEIEKLNNLTKETLLLCESQELKIVSEKILSSDLIKIDKFKNKINEKKINVKIEIEYLYVLCDKQKIKLVIDNLISNAINYTDILETIEIKVIRENDNAKFMFKNTGITLSDKEIKNVFNRYYRGDNAKRMCYDGTGLGLSIVKNILEGHKSKYGVFNENESVVFFFTLPIELVDIKDD